MVIFFGKCHLQPWVERGKLLMPLLFGGFIAVFVGEGISHYVASVIRVITSGRKVRLEHYAGRYQVEPGRDLVIRREGSRLYGQVYDLPEVELVVHSKKEFLLGRTPSRLVFDFDPEGTPTGLSFYMDGAEIHGDKIEERV